MDNEKEPKKRHRLRIWLITVGAVVLALLIGISATGLYNVPGLSALFGTNRPRDLGVETSEEALASIKDKIPMKIIGDNADYSDSTQAFTGSIDVDVTTDNEEITSWLQRFEGDNPIFSQTQVKKIEGGLEISTMVNKYIKAPVYVKVMIDQTAPNTLNLDIANAKVGAFTVPENYIQQAEDFFEDQINQLANSIPGFYMENYEIHENSSSFQGTFPAEVRPNAAGWSALVEL